MSDYSSILSDELWEKIEPWIPKRKNTHYRNGGRKPKDNRIVMTAIIFLLRTGCQWNPLNATGICPSSTAHDRFQKWVAEGLFIRLWEASLLEYDELKDIDWSWLSLDGAMTKAPLDGGKTGPNPTNRGKLGVKRSLLTDANGIPLGLSVAGTNCHDMKLVEDTLRSMRLLRPTSTDESPHNLCLDKGYDYNVIRLGVRQSDSPNIDHPTRQIVSHAARPQIA